MAKELVGAFRSGRGVPRVPRAGARPSPRPSRRRLHPDRQRRGRPEADRRHGSRRGPAGPSTWRCCGATSTGSTRWESSRRSSSASCATRGGTSSSSTRSRSRGARRSSESAAVSRRTSTATRRSRCAARSTRCSSNSLGGELKATLELGTVPGVHARALPAARLSGALLHERLRRLDPHRSPGSRPRKGSSARGGSPCCRGPSTRGSLSARGARSAPGSSAARGPANLS